MAASTITRSTWTNDTGTVSTPVGDGTILNNARLQEIYANIDALVAANLTFGGTVSAEGFGTHNFSTGGTGANVLAVRNTTAGTGNSARVYVGNDTSATLLQLMALSSTFTGGNNLSIVDASGAGGLIVRTSNAAGAISFGSGSAVLRAVLSAAGNLNIGTAVANDNYKLYVDGTVTPNATTGAGFRVDTTVNGAVNQNMFGAVFGPTLVEAASGTHGIVATMIINPPTITAGAAAVTTGASLYVNGAAAASGASNYALFVASGVSKLGAAITVTPVTASTGLSIDNVALGGGATTGPAVRIGYNTNGAPGHLGMVNRAGTEYFLWVDSSGNLRINTQAPTADNTTFPDTSVTVVGTQTSTRATKRQIRRVRDVRAALRTVLAAPLYRFKYRIHDRETDFLGIMADESPAFTMHRQSTFNPVNAAGYLIGAVQALAAQVRALEARLSAAGLEA